jgi:hypothetical protein
LDFVLGSGTCFGVGFGVGFSFSFGLFSLGFGISFGTSFGLGFGVDLDMFFFFDFRFFELCFPFIDCQEDVKMGVLMDECHAITHMLPHLIPIIEQRPLASDGARSNTAAPSSSSASTTTTSTSSSAVAGGLGDVEKKEKDEATLRNSMQAKEPTLPWKLNSGKGTLRRCDIAVLFC